MDEEFNQWLEELDEEARRMFGDMTGSYVALTGKECWRCYYEDGVSPLEALHEDEEYG